MFPYHDRVIQVKCTMPPELQGDFFSNIGINPGNYGLKVHDKSITPKNDPVICKDVRVIPENDGIKAHEKTINPENEPLFGDF